MSGGKDSGRYIYKADSMFASQRQGYSKRYTRTRDWVSVANAGMQHRECILRYVRVPLCSTVNVYDAS